MRRLFLISIAIPFMAMSAIAQEITKGGDDIKNLEIVRNDKTISVNMSVDISKLDVGADEIVILTPVIKKGDKSLELPSVEVMGRRAYMHYRRNDEKSVTDDPLYCQRTAKRAERKNGMKQAVDYKTSVGFEEWMRGASVELEKRSCGCDPTPKVFGKDVVGAFLPEIYTPKYVYSFIEPDPEPIKVRDESFTAYINFYLDRYTIVEEYKNNGEELASMINSIKKVDSDKDLTITSITIEGWASPEATERHNRELSSNRASALASYVTHKTGISRDQIRSIGRGEDWVGLRREVEKDKNLSDKERVLKIIDRTGISKDVKDAKLRELESYKYLMTKIYPRLRRNDYCIVYNVRNFNLEEARALVDNNPHKLSIGELYKVAGSYEKGSAEYTHVMVVAAKTYPKVVAAAVNYAAIQLSAKDYAGAIKTLEASDMSDARVLAMLGNIYIEQGDINKAKEAWNKAASMGNVDAQNNIKELEKYLQSL